MMFHINNPKNTYRYSYYVMRLIKYYICVEFALSLFKYYCVVKNKDLDQNRQSFYL